MWCKQYWHNAHLITTASFLDMEYIPRHLHQNISAVQSSIPQGYPLSTVYMITMEMNLHEDKFCGIRTQCTKIDGIPPRDTTASCYLHILFVACCQLSTYNDYPLNNRVILFKIYGMGGAVRFLVVGTIGKEERQPRGQLWNEQYLISLKYWPI